MPTLLDRGWDPAECAARVRASEEQTPSHFEGACARDPPPAVAEHHVTAFPACQAPAGLGAARSLLRLARHGGILRNAGNRPAAGIPSPGDAEGAAHASLSPHVSCPLRTAPATAPSHLSFSRAARCRPAPVPQAKDLISVTSTMWGAGLSHHHLGPLGSKLHATTMGFPQHPSLDLHAPSTAPPMPPPAGPTRPKPRALSADLQDRPAPHAERDVPSRTGPPPFAPGPGPSSARDGAPALARAQHASVSLPPPTHAQAQAQAQPSGSPPPGSGMQNSPLGERLAKAGAVLQQLEKDIGLSMEQLLQVLSLVTSNTSPASAVLQALISRDVPMAGPAPQQAPNGRREGSAGLAREEKRPAGGQQGNTHQQGRQDRADDGRVASDAAASEHPLSALMREYGSAALGVRDAGVRELALWDHAAGGGRAFPGADLARSSAPLPLAAALAALERDPSPPGLAGPSHMGSGDAPPLSRGASPAVGPGIGPLLPLMPRQGDRGSPSMQDLMAHIAGMSPGRHSSRLAASGGMGDASGSSGKPSSGIFSSVPSLGIGLGWNGSSESAPLPFPFPSCGTIGGTGAGNPLPSLMGSGSAWNSVDWCATQEATSGGKARLLGPHADKRQRTSLDMPPARQPSQASDTASRRWHGAYAPGMWGYDHGPDRTGCSKTGKRSPVAQGR